jgi:hypothetical protein
MKESLANSALHRIAARLRLLLNVQGHGWAARGELQALGNTVNLRSTV